MNTEDSSLRGACNLVGETDNYTVTIKSKKCSVNLSAQEPKGASALLSLGKHSHFLTLVLNQWTFDDIWRHVWQKDKTAERIQMMI